jgi:hypothetical protein
MSEFGDRARRRGSGLQQSSKLPMLMQTSRLRRSLAEIPTESTCQRRAKTRNIPRIPHIPRTETPARAKWGMRGKGGKIFPSTRWCRPILREPVLAGAGGYERSPGSWRTLNWTATICCWKRPHPHPLPSWRHCRSTRLMSCGSCTQPRIAHRRSTGTSYSISVQPLLSLPAGCRAPKPRLRHSNAALSSG